MQCCNQRLKISSDAQDKNNDNMNLSEEKKDDLPKNERVLLEYLDFMSKMRQKSVKEMTIAERDRLTKILNLSHAEMSRMTKQKLTAKMNSRTILILTSLTMMEKMKNKSLTPESLTASSSSSSFSDSILLPMKSPEDGKGEYWVLGENDDWVAGNVEDLKAWEKSRKPKLVRQNARCWKKNLPKVCHHTFSFF